MDLEQQPVAEAAFRREAVAALDAGDWHGAYLWAKGWIGRGGGAQSTEPWLIYAASGVLHGQPRMAVRSIDLALRHWISASADRAILLSVRGHIVRTLLKDPGAALADLGRAASDAPDWLSAAVRSDYETCGVELASSRRRKPSVAEAPEYEGPGTAAETVATPQTPRLIGGKPPVWEAVMARIREGQT